jgi:hypothetical protein
MTDEVYEHKKRGSRYLIVGEAEFQLSSDAPIKDGEVVVVYRSYMTGELYARRKSEFHDGRFEKIWPHP